MWLLIGGLIVGEKDSYQFTLFFMVERDVANTFVVNLLYM